MKIKVNKEEKSPMFPYRVVTRGIFRDQGDEAVGRGDRFDPFYNEYEIFHNFPHAMAIKAKAGEKITLWNGEIDPLFADLETKFTTGSTGIFWALLGGGEVTVFSRSAILLQVCEHKEVMMRKDKLNIFIQVPLLNNAFLLDVLGPPAHERLAIAEDLINLGYSVNLAIDPWMEGFQTMQDFQDVINAFLDLEPVNPQIVANKACAWLAKALKKHIATFQE